MRRYYVYHPDKQTRYYVTLQDKELTPRWRMAVAMKLHYVHRLFFKPTDVKKGDLV